MPELSFTEENYLKAIYYLQQENDTHEVSVNDIAEKMSTRPATVTDMLRKLSEKKLINYEKYKKTQLSKSGLAAAIQIVRKHRLWEVFLHEKLQFSWDEVHEVAEELEHIRSSKLIERLDAFLEFPRFDPHGDPIPNAAGEVEPASNTTLSESAAGKNLKLVAVKDTSSAFLQHLERFGLHIGVSLSIDEILPFDHSVMVSIAKAAPVMLSNKITTNLLVVELPVKKK
ncbi:metal-dependent transcriptional regulator [Taibaiella lutea]|uniref:Transcriptional regulator MntR n=1 Tax=Taibaiella lutea TaxID=2608001 RepID=A0A5M6CNS7_9BACT|nr:metal-dependent transcriptional regulator [Taibaiella lutea]KAA5536666.1 metal-dependent transcriptional regulator [Taibaiella lutea]